MAAGLTLRFSQEPLKYPIIPQPPEGKPQWQASPRSVTGSRTHYAEVEVDFSPVWRQQTPGSTRKMHPG